MWYILLTIYIINLMNLKSQICLYFGTKGVISRGGHGSVQDEN